MSSEPIPLLVQSGMKNSFAAADAELVKVKPETLGPAVIILAVVAGFAAAWIAGQEGASFGLQLAVMSVTTYSAVWAGLLVGRQFVRRK
jgi:hypothetical protein